MSTLFTSLKCDSYDHIEIGDDTFSLTEKYTSAVGRDM